MERKNKVVVENAKTINGNGFNKKSDENLGKEKVLKRIREGITDLAQNRREKLLNFNKINN